MGAARVPSRGARRERRWRGRGGGRSKWRVQSATLAARNQRPCRSVRLARGAACAPAPRGQVRSGAGCERPACARSLATRRRLSLGGARTKASCGQSATGYGATQASWLRQPLGATARRGWQKFVIRLGQAASVDRVWAPKVAAIFSRAPASVFVCLRVCVFCFGRQAWASERASWAPSWDHVVQLSPPNKTAAYRRPGANGLERANGS